MTVPYGIAVFEAENKGPDGQVNRPVCENERFASTKRPFLVTQTAGFDPSGDPSKADRPPWGPFFFGPQKVPYNTGPGEPRVTFHRNLRGKRKIAGLADTGRSGSMKIERR